MSPKDLVEYLKLKRADDIRINIHTNEVEFHLVKKAVNYLRGWHQSVPVKNYKQLLIDAGYLEVEIDKILLNL